MTLQEILNTVDVSIVTNFCGTRLTNSRIKRAHAQGRLIAVIDGDYIKVAIFSNDPREQFDFQQYRLKLVN